LLNLYLALLLLYYIPAESRAAASMLDSQSLPSINNYIGFSKTDTVESDSTILKIKKKYRFIKLNIIQNNFSSYFNFNKKEIDKTDYRYTGDLFLHFPFSYLFNLGYTGQPNEYFFYGLGYGNTSLISDGSSYNNKWENSFNLNLIQTESIKNISLLPLSKGFLFNQFNNPVTLQITESDSFKTKPISRIRYYQAPREGYIDAMFSTKVLPRVGLSFRVTNIAVDSGFANSSFGAWKTSFKTIYNFSDNFAAKLNYNYIKSETGLYGGINPESLNNLSETLYNRTLAVVNFYKRYSNTSFHKVDLNFYGNSFNNNSTNLNIGYENSLDIFKQNIDKPFQDSSRIINNNFYSEVFAKLEHTVQLNNFYTSFKACYEYNHYNIDYLNFNDNNYDYSISLLANYNIKDSLIIPSVYGKILNYNKKYFNGFGFDFSINLKNNFKFFLGISNFVKPYSLNERLLLTFKPESKQNIITLFASTKFSNKYFNTSLAYYLVKRKNVPVPVFNSKNIKTKFSKIIYPFLTNIISQGINILSENKIGKFLYTLNLNYYFIPTTFDIPSSPNLTFTTGIYFNDNLYNNNLDLKTGFTFYYGKTFNYVSANQGYRIYDFQQFRGSNGFLVGNTAQHFTIPVVKNNINRLDFFLSARIRKRATFYFTVENILDNNYYIVPFYPMRQRSIKIGIAWDFIN